MNKIDQWGAHRLKKEYDFLVSKQGRPQKFYIRGRIFY